MSSVPKVVIQDLSFSYSEGAKPALELSQLILEGPSVVALIGSNGSGKSTLAKILAGLLRLEREGVARVDGWDVARYDAAQLSHRLTYLLQNPWQQFFCATVWQELMASLALAGYQEKEAKRRALESLSRFQLEEFRDLHPFDLSYSQQKLLSLAIAWSLDRKILVLDEPAAGLDERVLVQLFSQIEQWKQEGKLVIWIGHDWQDFLGRCDRVVWLERAKLFYEGGMEGFLDRVEEHHPQELPLVARLGRRKGWENRALSDEQVLERMLEQNDASI